MYPLLLGARRAPLQRHAMLSVGAGQGVDALMLNGRDRAAVVCLYSHDKVDDLVTVALLEAGWEQTQRTIKGQMNE